MTGASRDIGLKSGSAGKGDAPRNTGPKFYENFNSITFMPPPENDGPPDGFKRFGTARNKLRKVYK